MLKYYFDVINFIEFILNIFIFIFSYSKNLFFKAIKIKDSGAIHVLGNGPSLKNDQANFLLMLNETKQDKVIVVNSFATDPLFERLKPSYYVFVDSAYFKVPKLNKIKVLQENVSNSLIDKTNWPLNLLVSISSKNSKFLLKICRNKNINICYFKNLPIIGGYKSVNNILFQFFGANPLFQNVLITAIFQCIKIGFSKIYVWGADHNWHEDYLLGKDNVLYTLDKHFYSKTHKKIIHCSEDGIPTRVHEEFATLSRAFKIYHSLEFFAKKLNCKIINLSSTTWIDAFDRDNSK